MTTLAMPSLSIRDRTLLALALCDVQVALFPCRPGEDCVRGRVDADVVIRQLLHDPRWQLQAIRSGFHAELGKRRVEFRSYTRMPEGGPRPLCPGSIQVVINPDTGDLYADKDRFNPGQDVAGAVGHGAVDVLPNHVGRPLVTALTRAWRWLTRR